MVRSPKTPEEKVIDETVKSLTQEIKGRQEHVLRKMGGILGQENSSFQQFNGVFGGKNNIYTDLVSTNFQDFDDFFAQWLKGLIDRYEQEKEIQLSTYGRIFHNNAAMRNFQLIKEDDIRALVVIFLERNFYKRLKERTREKPNENHWAVWFGYRLIYGLIIAPARRGGSLD